MSITNETIVGELTAQDYRAASVFKKFAVDFCCNGNRTIKEVCEMTDINPADIIGALQSALTVNNDTALDFKTWPADLLADYIEKKHHRFVKDQAIEIKPYLHKISKVHGDIHPELYTIEKLFNAGVDELTTHMEKEESVLFPFVRKMKQEKFPQQNIAFRSIKNPIETMMLEHNVEGERFREISALSNSYTPPPDACNTYRVAFALLKAFEEDLHLHIHLENNILFPQAIALEKSLAN